MIRGVHHVALATADLDRLSSWYVDVLGFEVVMATSWRDRPLIDRMIGVEGTAAKQVMLRAGNAHIEMFEYSAPEATPGDGALRQPHHRGYTHFCLDVTDIDAEHARLSAAGMTFHSTPPTTEEQGHSRLRAIYGRDPDGNIIELQEVIDSSIPFALDNAPLIDAECLAGDATSSTTTSTSPRITATPGQH